MIKKIILVFKTHFDIGFTDLASRVIEQYVHQMLPQVLETCRATEHMGKLKYVWTMPSWPLKVMLEQCDGKMREELEHYIENGQVAWHALPFTSHTDFCGEEEYLESLRYGKMLSEKYGKPYPIAAKMTDVPGHGWMLPEILCSSGIRFLHLGCNAFATPPEVPELFYWQTPGGQKLLTMYNRGGYGSGLEIPEDWEYPVWMALIHTHDNCGPHSAEFIRKLVQEAKELYPEAEIVCGTMDDFARELEACDLSKIPTVEKDLADTWIHGIGAYPNESAKIRELRHRSTRMQKFRAQFGIEEDGGLLDTYYENMHLFGEHTWGADVKTWLGPDRVYRKKEFLQAKNMERYQFMEASWEEQRERARLCEKTLAHYREQFQKETAEKTFFYNPTALPYSGWTELPSGNGSPAADGSCLETTKIFGKDACYVKDLPPLAVTEVERRSCEAACVHEEVAIADSEGPLYKGEASTPDSELFIKEENGITCVENHRYRLEFLGKTGRITQLFDKKYERALLKEIDGTAVFSWQYTKHGVVKMTEFLRKYGYRFPAWGVQDYGRENYPECKTQTWTPVFEDWKTEGNTICFTYKNEESADAYGDAVTVRVEVTLPQAGDELFVQLHLSNKQECPYIESGSLCMPLPEELQQYRINKNGCILDPEKDIADNANHVYYALEHFVSAGDENGGICVMPWDTPLLSIGEDGCYTYRHQYEKTSPILYFNGFNNMWGTNFPQWQGGDYSYRFILWGYGAGQEAQLYERAAQLSEGLEIINSSAKKLSAEGLSADPFYPVLPKGMELMNLKREKNGYLLVTRELTGAEKQEALKIPGFLVSETDYYGRVKGEKYRDSLPFWRRRYGLHLFRAEASSTCFS